MMQPEPHHESTSIPESVFPIQPKPSLEPSPEIPTIDTPSPCEQQTKEPTPPQKGLFSQRKPKALKQKKLLKRRPKKHPAGKQKPDEPQKPLKATFTLRIDSEGNLVGLPIKKHWKKKEKTKKKHLPIPLKNPFRKSTKEESEQETEQTSSKFSIITTIPKKITKIVSRLKPGKSGSESSENPLKRSIGKLKNIFSRS